MARKVFFSFHFDNDYWRTQQVRNINSLEGQPLCTPNAWEEVKRKGDTAIKNWIDENMRGKSCVVVLVGSQTATRPWVIYEINKAWSEGKGVLGIRIHKLLNSNGQSASPGANPLSKVTLPNSIRTLADVAPLKDPAGFDSKSAYASIVNNVESWIEEAIRIRNSTR